jgi:hypothetical protein
LPDNQIRPPPDWGPTVFYAGYGIRGSQELVNMVGQAIEVACKAGGTALVRSEEIVDLETGAMTIYSFAVGGSIPILIRTTNEAPREAI